MGGEHGNNRPGADEPSGVDAHGRRGRTGHPAPPILQAPICSDDAGGIDPGDRVRQCRQPAAGARRGAKARNSTAAERWRRPSSRSAATADRKCSAGVTGRERWDSCSPIWGIRFLTLLLANGSANFTLHADLNWHVLGLAAALSLLTGVLFGLAPALQSTRVDVMPALKNTRAGETRSRFGLKLSHVLVVVQIAMLLLMLVAAGLFVRTLQNLQSVELGFNRENVLLFQLDARKAGHNDPEIASFYSDLQNRFSAIPGVRRASLSEDSLCSRRVLLFPSACPARPPAANRILIVGPAFLPLCRFPCWPAAISKQRDRPGSPPVAVVSESFAKTNFGNQSPVGQHLTLGGRAPLDLEIVGVAKDARSGGLKRSMPLVVYIPYHLQPPSYPLNQMVYALRTSGDPLAYVNTVREIVHQADPLLPLTNIQNASRANRPVDQPGNHVCQVVYRLRDSGAGSRLRRSVWHHFLYNRAPHGRDRHSDGARARNAEVWSGWFCARSRC